MPKSVTLKGPKFLVLQSGTSDRFDFGTFDTQCCVKFTRNSAVTKKYPLSCCSPGDKNAILMQWVTVEWKNAFRLKYDYLDAKMTHKTEISITEAIGLVYAELHLLM